MAKQELKTFAVVVVRLIRRCGTVQRSLCCCLRSLSTSPSSFSSVSRPKAFSTCFLLIYADCNRATRENTLCRKTWQPCRQENHGNYLCCVVTLPHPFTLLPSLRSTSRANCNLCDLWRICSEICSWICSRISWLQFGIRPHLGPRLRWGFLMTCKLIADSRIYSSNHVVWLSIH